LKIARDVLTSGEYDLVIMDEINNTTDLGMVRVEEVLEIIDGKKENVELIMTGRDPHPEYLKRAHLITEMKLDRHYFYSGVAARAGLDY